MLGRTTRLEFIIVTVAFLVLMLCSKPPRPGSAEVEDLRSPQPAPREAAVAFLQEPAPSIEVNASEPARSDEAPVDEPTPETANGAAEPEAGPPVARMGTVDARNCTGLNYDNVMQGEITARWVWDGQRFTPEKVCVVQGPDGVSTVWSFEQQGEAVLSETEAPSDSGR